MMSVLRYLLLTSLPLFFLEPVFSSEPVASSAAPGEASQSRASQTAALEVSQREIAPPEPIVPPPKRELRLVLDWYPGPQHAPVYLAKALGYLETDDIELEIVTPADPSVPSKLVAASRADLALTRQPRLHLDIAEQKPLIRVATLIDSPLALLTVREDSKITDIAQLAGKDIGYAVEDNLSPSLSTLLEDAELVLDDVSLKDVDFDVVQALVQQRVDAVIGGQRPMLAEQLSREGVLSRGFLIEEHGVPAYDGLILIANRNHLQRQRETIQHLVTAIERASLWLVNHPEKAWQRLVEVEPSLDTPANRRAWPALIRRFSLSPAGLDSHRYARFEKFLKDRGEIETLHPVSRLAVDIYAP